MTYHIIVNPAGASGKTGKVWKRIEPVFRESGQEYEVHYSSPGHGIADICRELEEMYLTGQQEKLVLVTIGGDGSVNEAMNGITDPSRILYGHIPAGSGNDIIRDMHLPKKAEDVARSILEGKVKRYFDVGELTYMDESDAAEGSAQSADSSMTGKDFEEAEEGRETASRKEEGDSVAAQTSGSAKERDRAGASVPFSAHLPDSSAKGKESIAAGASVPQIERSWAAHIGTGASRRFAISCGIGFDAGICEMSGRSRFKDVLNRLGLGKLIYLVSAFRLVQGQKSDAVTLTLDPGTEQESAVCYDHVLLLACMNHQHEGGGFQFAPKAAYDDGILDLCIADPAHNSAFYKIFPFALFGAHYRFRCIHAHTAAAVDIRAALPMWVHTDGEVERKACHIRVRVLKEKLAVLE